MGALNFIVFSAIFSASLCEETNTRPAEPTSILTNTLYKQGSEIDSRMRDRISKTIAGTMNHPIIIQPGTPTNKLSTSLRPSKNITYSNNILPRRHIHKVVHYNPKTPINPTEDKPPADITDRDDNKITNNTKLNKTIKSIENTIIDSQDYETISKEIEINKEQSVPVALEEENGNELSFVEEESENNTGNEKENSTIDSIEDLSANNTFLIEQPSEMTRTEPEIITEENHENFDNPIKNLTVIENDGTKYTKTAHPDPKISLGINLMPIFIKASKRLVPKINQVPVPPSLTTMPNLITASKIKTNKLEEINEIRKTQKMDTVDKNSQDIVKNEIKIKVLEDQDSPLKPLKIGPNEEIAIKNSSFEELYKSSLQYTPSEIITKELPLGQNNNVTPVPSDPNDKYEATGTYNNKPYSYDIKRYPNQYVVSTYDERRHINNNNASCAKRLNNNYSNFYRPRAPKGQWDNFNKYQGKVYSPNRIWRSWNNNEIVIRHKSGDANNEFNRSNNRYSADVRYVPIYKAVGKVTGPSEYGNQNMASNNNPIKFNNRYGY